jgi:hypothetical protein
MTSDQMVHIFLLFFSQWQHDRPKLYPEPYTCVALIINQQRNVRTSSATVEGGQPPAAMCENQEEIVLEDRFPLRDLSIRLSIQSFGVIVKENAAHFSMQSPSRGSLGPYCTRLPSSCDI